MSFALAVALFACQCRGLEFMAMENEPESPEGSDPGPSPTNPGTASDSPAADTPTSDPKPLPDFDLEYGFRGGEPAETKTRQFIERRSKE